MQFPEASLTYPSTQMQAGVLQVGVHAEIINLLQLRWQPSLPQPEYTALAPQVMTAEKINLLADLMISHIVFKNILSSI